MPDQGAASEFGGAVRGLVGVQPVPPHVLTAAEKLRLIYLTGDETGETMVPVPEVWEGLLPAEEQRKIREGEGVLEKGQLDVFDAT